MTPPSAGAVRPARDGDAEHLPDVERAAGELFRTVGLDAVADDEVETVEQFRALIATRPIWVAESADAPGIPVGYALASDVGGHVHLDQLSVHPDHRRRGLGTALVDAVAQWAEAQGAPSITLTTFRDVAWNRPFYEGVGFVVDPWAVDDPDLAHVATWEAEHDFGSPRVWMRRSLG